ncbi:Nucleoside triphosphate pyrophosphohydrolase [subsurface metagenome]
MKIYDLIKLVETLRKECPWDREQTLDSLKNNVIEESYELIEAIEDNDVSSIKEEIGDILFLGFFLAKIFEEEKDIGFDELILSTVKKYKDKHPHVFKEENFSDQDAVLRFWQKTKKDIFAGISKVLPALLAAKIIQERASKLGFDWETHKGPLEKINEEIKEIEKSSKTEDVFEEFGDLLFACVNLARHLSVDPEDALRYANKKFVKRFRKVMEELKKRGKDIEATDLEEMDKIWDEIKKREG